MEVLLDTNFIISCLLKKIDFLEILNEKGFRIIVPREVLQELKDLRRDEKTSRAERQAIELSFQILVRKKVEKVNVGGRTVDEGLVAKGQQGAYIATLDRGIKVKVPNRVVIDNAAKSLKIERD